MRENSRKDSLYFQWTRSPKDKLDADQWGMIVSKRKSRRVLDSRVPRLEINRARSVPLAKVKSIAIRAGRR